MSKLLPTIAIICMTIAGCSKVTPQFHALDNVEGAASVTPEALNAATLMANTSSALQVASNSSRPSMLKLSHVDTILLVENIEVSKSFYSGKLGLEVLQDWKTMIVYKERFAILQENALLPTDEARKFVKPGPQGRGNVVIYFQSNDLQASYDKLTAEGVKMIHGIIKLPWERIFRAYDPDGYVIEIGELH